MLYNTDKYCIYEEWKLRSSYKSILTYNRQEFDDTLKKIDIEKSRCYCFQLLFQLDQQRDAVSHFVKGFSFRQFQSPWMSRTPPPLSLYLSLVLRICITSISLKTYVWKLPRLYLEDLDIRSIFHFLYQFLMLFS